MEPPDAEQPKLWKPATPSSGRFTARRVGVYEGTACPHACPSGYSPPLGDACRRRSVTKLPTNLLAVWSPLNSCWVLQTTTLGPLAGACLASRPQVVFVGRIQLRWLRAVATKLACIVKTQRDGLVKIRFVIDLHRSGVTGLTHLPQKVILPRVKDFAISVVDIFLTSDQSNPHRLH